MARNFNQFTYINNDVLSLMSNLQHNISDLEGRASFSVAGFVPVYDHRLDSISSSPFLEKFGNLNSLGFADKFPQVFSDTEDTSPFPILNKKLDGILCDDDIYIWRNIDNSAGLPADYILSNSTRTIDNQYSKTIIPIAYMECILGPRLGEMYILEYTTSPKPPIIMDSEELAWNEMTDNGSGPESVTYDDTLGTGNKWTFKQTAKSSEDNLKCIPDVANKSNNTLNGKTLVSFPNTPTYKLISKGPAIDFNQEKETIVYEISTPAIYDTGDDINSPVYPAPLISMPIYEASLLGNSGAATPEDRPLTWTLDEDPTNIIATQTPIFSKSKDVDLGRLKLNNFNAFSSIRYFAKSSQDETGKEKTIANYRIEFNEQVGSVMFNKIVTYVKLYRKDKNGAWGWGDRLYPFTVTLLADPVIKSNVGADGIDVFELDIEIDYDQHGDYSSPDFEGVISIPTFIPVTNTLRNDTNNFTGAMDVNTDTNKYIGAQTDKRLFMTDNIDPLNEVELDYEWVLNKVNENKWAKRNNINNNYGRLNSDNLNLIYKDIDFSEILYYHNANNNTRFDITTKNPTNGNEETEEISITLDTHITYNNIPDAGSEYITDGLSPKLILGETDIANPDLVNLIENVNIQKLAIINYYISIRRICSENPYASGMSGTIVDADLVLIPIHTSNPEAAEEITAFNTMKQALEELTTPYIQ